MTASLSALAGVAIVLATGATLVLAALGAHALVLALTRALRPARPLPTREPDAWPAIVVQIPVYDEPPALVARALDAALATDYPGPVEVQLLDDSPREGRLANAVLCAERRGVRHLPRATRDGFKAGALAHGLGLTRAPLAAVFDVDFRPAPDVLRRLVGPLLADERLAFVQARWTHPGADRTWLGRAQAAVLDLHFAVEQGGRDRAGLPVLFNGSGGVWRVAAIADAGGWRGDTLAEDLDLTIRALARGWRSRLADDVTVAADLPATAGAWRRQQTRWAKGLAEVARQHVGTVWRSPLGPGAKVALSAHLGLSLSLPALLVLAIVHPVVAVATAGGAGAGVGLSLGYVALAGLGVGHAVALRSLYAEDWPRRLARIPASVLAPLVLLVPAALGVAEAVVGRRTPFARTPKGGEVGGEPAGPEMGLAVWSAAGWVALVAVGAWGAVPFQTLLVLGFVGGVRALRRPPRVRLVRSHPEVSRAAA